MPIAEFDCPVHGKFEKLFLSRKEFDKAKKAPCMQLEEHEDSHAEPIPCGIYADRVISAPNHRFLGEGFHKPSAVQAPIHNASDPTKLLPEFGVFDSRSGERVGRRHLKKLDQQLGILNDAREGKKTK